jgi:hypothetical protein
MTFKNSGSQMALHGFWATILNGSPSQIDLQELGLLIEPHVHKLKEVLKRIQPAE